MSKIIYLNGPSSSGKTSLAKALQKALTEPYLHMGMDMARLLASQHYNLIIDDIAFEPIYIEEWREVLKGYPVLYIGVTTPLEILEERKRKRGDRFLGTARAQYFKVH